MLLVHQPKLLALLDAWVCALKPEIFQEVLPLVRRAFSQFPQAERRQIAARVADGLEGGETARPDGAAGIDWARARQVLPLIEKLLGVKVQT